LSGRLALGDTADGLAPNRTAVHYGIAAHCDIVVDTEYRISALAYNRSRSEPELVG
jgi:hypothetical protein